MAPPNMLPPLSLDLINEGRPIASPSSILFNIPREILDLIIDHVASDKSHLASLALVNSTCRQLARSCQFNNLHLDYGYAALQVLPVLQKEAAQRYRSSDRMTVSPSLAACVRQLKVDATNFWPCVQSRLPLGLHSAAEPDVNREIERTRTVEILAKHLHRIYWPTALSVIPTLPNLQSLCISELSLEDDLLDCLIKLPIIKHLEVSGKFLRIPDMRTTQNSRHLDTLEELRIETSWEICFGHKTNRLDASGFYNTLLASCCSNLRLLEFSHTVFYPFSSNMMPKEMPLSFCMEFPKLKTLRIGRTAVVDARVLTCLVREGLTSLNIPYNDNDTCPFLSKLGQIRTLVTVLLHGDRATGSTSTAFIETNTQIRSLAITCTVDAFLGRVLQSLHTHRSLKSLSLVWRDHDIPKESLGKLSLLSSIEMLHLSAGHRAGRYHGWFVDHNELRRYVGRLDRLRRLILTRDNYMLQSNEGAIFEPKRSNDGYEPGSAFWAAHETRMTEHAIAYVRTLPRLEFLHIGQVIFTVKENNGVREPVATGSVWVGEGEYMVLEEEFGIYDMSL